MGTTETGHDQRHAESSGRKLNAGLLALLILVLNTAGVFWAVWAVGDGVDSGIGLFYYLFSVTFPQPLPLSPWALSVSSVAEAAFRAPSPSPSPPVS